MNNRRFTLEDFLFIEKKKVESWKGKVSIDTGCIYAPYIEVMLTPQIDNSFLPSKLISSRYKTMINTKFYGQIKFDKT